MSMVNYKSPVKASTMSSTKVSNSKPPGNQKYLTLYSRFSPCMRMVGFYLFCIF